MRNQTTVLSLIRLQTWGNVLRAAFVWLLCMTTCYAQNWPVSVVAPHFGYFYSSYIALDAVGNVYAADTRSIHKYTPTGIGYVPQNDIAQLEYAYSGGMVIDGAGNVYVCDQNAVHKFGPGPLYQKDEDVASSLTGATGLAVDTTGNVYVIASTASNTSTVLKFAPTANGYVRQADVVADTRQFVSLAVDRDDTVFVGSEDRTIRKYSLHGTNYVRDTDVAVANSTPIGIAIDDAGAIYVAESTSASGAVRKFQPSGAGYIEAPHVDDFTTPLSDVKVDRLGNIYVAEGPSLAIRKYSPAGSAYVRQADVVDWVNQSLATATDGNGNVYVADYRHISKYRDTGVGYALQREVSSSPLGWQAGVAVDSNGNVYVTDSLLRAVHKYSDSASGYIKQADVANSGLSAPTGIAVDGLGNVYVVDTGYYPNVSVVRVYRPDGTGYSKLADVPGSNFIGSFQGIAVDAGGNIYVADVYSVHKYARTSSGYTALPDLPGYVWNASGIAVDSAGNVYVADQWGIHQYVLSNGTYSESTPPYSFGNAVVPQGISVDEHSSVFFTDGTNQLLSATLSIVPATTTIVASSINPSTSGQNVTFTATVSGSSPTGKVTFTDGGTPVCINVVLNQGSAGCSVSALSVGSHWITASYGGDANNAASISTALVQIVNSGYVPLNPSRLLDTRIGFATVDGLFQGQGQLPKLGQIDLSVLGRGGVAASGVDAVVLNVTITNPLSAGYATVWPAGSTLPNASNLNYVAGDTVANLVVVKLGTNNQVSLFSLARTDMIADVVGYFVSGSDLTSFAPERLLDTRTGTITLDGQDAGIGAVGPNGILNLPIAGRGSVPASGAGSVILNLTATAPTAPGYITAWSGDVAQPLASTLNFLPDQTVPNLVIGKLSSTGAVSFFNSAGTTDLIADVTAWLPENAELTPLTPARLLDTRIGAGNTTIDGLSQGTGRLQAATPFDLTVAGRGGVPLTGVSAVILNVTVTNPGTAGFLQVWPSGSTRPNASNLNYVSGQTIANLVIAKVGVGGKVSLFSVSKTDAIVDVVGWLQ